MTKQNKTLFSSVMAVMLFTTLASSPAIAVELTPPVTRERETRNQEQKTSVKNTILENKKTNANKEIERRVTSLNGLIVKINNIKKLSESQKAAFVSMIQSEINSLETLKAKIAADTDLETLKVDKQSIVQSYRIYALFLPQISILSHADVILNIVDMMKTKSPDATALEKIESAYTQTQSAINLVVSLTPDGYPGNKTSLESARKLLQSARLDLNAARPLLNKTK